MNTKPTLRNVCVSFVNALRFIYALSVFDKKFQKVRYKTVHKLISLFYFTCKLTVIPTV